MNDGYPFTLAGQSLVALGSGALWWPEQRLLCVSDLHLGKSERLARRGGAHLPPYETRDTLLRLQAEIDAFQPKSVICLGDSFDDTTAAQSLPERERIWIARLQAGRQWIWIEGNHDPGPVSLGGSHMVELPLPPLTFRHIADPAQSGEISGHYHPKASIRTRLRTVTRPCFLVDGDRVILPAFGTYTGGLQSADNALRELMREEALAVLTGKTARPMPMPR
ncbi:ligase-associated DNA damage response endonuclease PdeM [Lutimaribacter sp. EGI FJ00015]|uniref:Ligase-associated DNA damage response endonuclease PdeM n=1 Tax=Lutimaribacter degradans TaxID=2945989 RepID=A0ACC5ZQM5_9RHOB|nr:ligase-associated DNA damage response endonuclease PdeM [Lutimaribacter sp. EGI FJ00013]MCM2560603.1 ligase-associated DNA damage response endonuclease PdeM [Lutimaribacter sp. EGI FJ00013]MCO0612454.1 ligase-associated DNA damage response endonuclease PdeM [Lutimaribacter sp. EGI FJ00015]MCO0634427.1 ligase-associated DNA damage response endonuclease PdeM [Lutimaribacter sp. EGI FJ00014]